MANKDLSLTSDFTGLDMKSLIGGPLMAAADANNSMAVTQTKFLLDTCFKKPNAIASGSSTTPAVSSGIQTDEYAPLMIDMSLDIPVITQGPPMDIKKSTVKFQLPLLTIIPLNSLAVQTVEVAFEMEVKSAFSEDQTDKKESDLKAAATFDAKVGFGPFSCSIKGNVSYDQKDSTSHSNHYEKTNSAKYAVKVTAGQLPLPKGVNTILDIFSKAIQPITPPSSN
jgi:hypothetical protein